MDCVSMYNKICGYYNKGVCAQLIRSTDDIFESGNMVPHENVCIRKINLQKTSINHGILRRELLNYKFQGKIALPFVLEKNAGKALIS